MEEDTAYSRSLWQTFSESVTRFAGTVQRWLEASDAARITWGDRAGREAFEKYLDPHRLLLPTGQRSLAAAVEAQRAALDAITRADAQAQRAMNLLAEADAACKRSRAQAGVARTDASTARGDISRARSMSADVCAVVNGLGE